MNKHSLRRNSGDPINISTVTLDEYLLLLNNWVNNNRVKLIRSELKKLLELLAEAAYSSTSNQPTGNGIFDTNNENGVVALTTVNQDVNLDYNLNNASLYRIKGTKIITAFGDNSVAITASDPNDTLGRTSYLSIKDDKITIYAGATGNRPYLTLENNIGKLSIVNAQFREASFQVLFTGRGTTPSVKIIDTALAMGANVAPGSVLTTKDGDGVAQWLPPNSGEKMMIPLMMNLTGNVLSYNVSNVFHVIPTTVGKKITEVVIGRFSTTNYPISVRFMSNMNGTLFTANIPAGSHTDTPTTPLNHVLKDGEYIWIDYSDDGSVQHVSLNISATVIIE